MKINIIKTTKKQKINIISLLILLVMMMGTFLFVSGMGEEHKPPVKWNFSSGNLVVKNVIINEDLNVTGDLEVNGSFIGSMGGIKFRVKEGKDLFSIFPFHQGVGGSGNIPEDFDDALILQTDDISNQYKMEFCWWDEENDIMTFCSNEGYPNRATTFRRSFQIVGNVSVKENDLNFTLCEGYSYIDCDTITTGADLGVQDDIEALGSIFANDNITIKNLEGVGNEYACFDSSGTLFRSSIPCVP